MNKLHRGKLKFCAVGVYDFYHKSQENILALGIFCLLNISQIKKAAKQYLLSDESLQVL